MISKCFSKGKIKSPERIHFSTWNSRGGNFIFGFFMSAPKSYRSRFFSFIIFAGSFDTNKLLLLRERLHFNFVVKWFEAWFWRERLKILNKARQCSEERRIRRGRRVPNAENFIWPFTANHGFFKLQRFLEKSLKFSKILFYSPNGCTNDVIQPRVQRNICSFLSGNWRTNLGIRFLKLSKDSEYNACMNKNKKYKYTPTYV